MTILDKNRLIISIENTAAIISNELGPEVVSSVFEKYGAHGIYDLSPSSYTELFSELYAIEADLK